MRPRISVVKNDFPELAAKLAAGADRIAEETAQDIAGEIRQTAPDHVKADVSVERDGPGKRVVTVGDLHKLSFDAAMQEYGTASRGARPYVTPAAERARERFEEMLGRILRG